MVPLRYGVPWTGQNYGVNVAVYTQDGTVAISHGGVEVGQGINTKVFTLCLYSMSSSLERTVKYYVSHVYS